MTALQRESNLFPLSQTWCITHVGVAAAAAVVAGVSDEEEVAADVVGSRHKMRSTSHTAVREVELSTDGSVMIESHVDQSLSA